MSKKVIKHDILSFPTAKRHTVCSLNEPDCSGILIHHPSSQLKQESNLIDTTELEQVAERLRNGTLPLSTQNLIQQYIYGLKTLGQ